MSTLLCIHSYPSAGGRVKMFWPGYKLPSWDILGIDAEGVPPHAWPEDVPHVAYGANQYSYYNSPHLLTKLVKSFEYGLTLPQNYDEICVIEHDGIFIRTPPKHPGGFTGTLSGYTPPGWNSAVGNAFLHTPWWADRETAQKIVTAGNAMIAARDWGNGSPDVWIGKLLHDHAIPWTGSNTWAVNGGSLSERGIEGMMRMSISKAIINGVWYIHGLRTQEEFDWIQRERDFYDKR